MTNGILDFQHTSGPAPAYAIESDSEEDEWADEPIQAAGITTKKPEEATQDRKLEWHPSPPHGHSPVELMIFIGDIGLLVGSGLPEQLRSEFFQLDQYILLAKSAPFVLSPDLFLFNFNLLWLGNYSRYQSYNITIVSSYQAPTYIPSSNDHPPIRYLASSAASATSLEKLGCSHYQANILKIESKMLLLPSIGVPHDEKSTTSIPIGQYDFTSSMTGGPSGLLGLDHPHTLRIISTLMAQFFNPHPWEFPASFETNLVTLYRDKLKLDRDRKSIPTSSDALTHHHDSSGLMYM
ncbi:hypothetical protein PSTT_01092 [Puccinia striiformis]|uniref:Uncharacterized protein n=1 Tax=Puccinia striiformis TaxID=27350 RepID=A0A2S4W4B8_9BASI|nr:hypothetical protein PSTT_01092 [Puccinia striiformis]